MPCWGLGCGKRGANSDGLRRTEGVIVLYVHNYCRITNREAVRRAARLLHAFRTLIPQHAWVSDTAKRIPMRTSKRPRWLLGNCTFQRWKTTVGALAGIFFVSLMVARAQVIMTIFLSMARNTSQLPTAL